MPMALSQSGLPTYRARLRFRLIKRLNIEANEHRLSMAGTEVVLAAQTPDAPICDREWLVMNARSLAPRPEGTHSARVASP